MTSPLKSQVVSLQLSKRLKELGVPQESMFYWVEFKTFPVKSWQILSKDELRTINFPELAISAFLVGELGEMLPEKVKSDDIFTVLKHEKYGKFFRCIYYQKDIDSMYKYLYQTSDLSEAEARAKMLIYLLENNLIKASDL